MHVGLGFQQVIAHTRISQFVVSGLLGFQGKLSPHAACTWPFQCCSCMSVLQGLVCLAANIIGVAAGYLQNRDSACGVRLPI